MSLLAQKRHSNIQRHLPTFLFVLLLTCLTSACGPSTLTSTNQTRVQNACLDVVHSIYAVQGQTLYTAISAPQHPLKRGETYNKVLYRINLVAFNVNNGQKLWSHTLAENVSYLSSFVTEVQVINHTVYIDGGNVIAADSSDGHTLWRHEGIGLGAVGIRMYVCADTLYQIDETGQIMALRTSDGTQLWSSTVKNLTISSTFTITNQGIYIISRSGLTALGLKNGKILWTHPYNNFANFVSVTADSQAVYTIHRPDILALDPTTGKTLRPLQTHNGPFFSTSTIWDHTLYLFGPDTIVAIDIRNGKQLWENRNPLSDNPRYFVAITSQDIYTNTLLLDEGKDHFCALNSDSGKDRWCIDNLRPSVLGIMGSYLMTTSDTAVFILNATDNTSTIHALNKKDGSVLWKTPYSA